MDIKIAPSILTADFSKIADEVKSISDGGADYIHLDVMDGNFVKNITFGPKFIADIRPYTNKIFDAHLMILNPWNYIENFVKAGADIITVHYEACKERLIDTLKQIKSYGVKCGIVLNPDVAVDNISGAIEYADMVLLMSVFPGFGGQKFIPDVLPKIEQVAKIVQNLGKKIDIEVDGGINKQNVRSVKDAGANVIVAGSTVFNETDRAKIIEELRIL